ncbi:MAG: autotransporter-associated beta strand repeat-containing protein [Verrucomicrobiales bacterium]|nr:autotransporter-associated beta strand repeat-containing protein [Verrucomicrobiales bacterium]
MSAYTRFLRALRSRILTAMALILIALSSGPASATLFYWDVDGSDSGNTTGGANLGGTGTWDALASNWWDGLNPLNSWLNSPDDSAVFTYAYPALGIPSNFGVTVAGGGVTTGGISFLRSGYTLSGGAITLAGSAPTLHATLGDSATISSNLLGTAGLTKTGGGSIRLSGTNTYTGTTTIANGTLIITNGNQLGTDPSAVVVTGFNPVPTSTNVRGFGGGALLLDGTSSGFTFSRNLSLQGTGPIADRSAALISVGNNTVSGAISMGVPAFGSGVNTRMTAANGTLNLSGSLDVDTTIAIGTTGTTINTLGGTNQAGVSTYNLTGALTGDGTLEKSGVGTLLLNPSNTSGFTGAVRVSSSATGQQSTVRITTPGVLGTRTASGTSSVLDLNVGILEVRMDTPSVQAGGGNANVYIRGNGSTIFADHAAGSSVINGILNLGILTHEDGAGVTFSSRNGYGMAFTTAPVNGADGDSTFTNSLGGTLSFTGNFWSNANTAAVRTMNIGGNGNTVINGGIIASGGASFDHVLTKTGSGSLTITGTNSTLDGAVNIQGGAVRITDFRSLTNNTSAINIGTGTTAGALIIGTSTAPNAAGLTTSKVINLAGTTGAASILANQAGTDPVVLNANFTATGVNLKTLNLGGTSSVDNVINGSIVNNASGQTQTSANYSTGATTITLASVLGIQVGDVISGTGIQGGTTITAINTGTRVVTLSLPTTAGITATATITTPNVQNATALAKVGSGVWVLGGTNTFTGVSTISNGTLKLRANAATSTIIDNASGVTFAQINQYAGGTLEFVGQPAVNNVETMAALTPTDGANTLKLSPGVGGTASMVFSSVGTIGDGATVNIMGSDGVTNTVTLTGQTGLNASPRLFFGGSDFAFGGAGGVMRAPVYGTDSGFVNAPTGGALPAGQDSFSINGAITAQGSQTVDTLKFNGAQTLTLASGATLTIRTGAANTDGAILATGGSSMITGGTGLSTGGSGSLTFYVNGEANSLTIDTVLTAGTTGGITKSGTGTLILTKDNLQTGTITLNEGKIQLSGSGDLGAGASLTMRQGTTLDLNGISPTSSTNTFTNNGTVTSAAPATFTVGGANGTGTSLGIVSGAVSLTKVGTGNQSWLGDSTYTGVTTIGSTGLVTVNTLADGGLASGIGASSNAASNLVFNGSTGGLVYQGAIVDGNLTLGSRSASTNRLFTLAGTGATISNTATNNNALVWSNTGAIAHGIVGPQNLILTGTSTADNTFNPQLTDSGTGGDITSLSKTGAGQWNLGNPNNTYTGTTSVSNGVLALNENGALPASSPLALGTTTTAGILQMSGNFTRSIAAAATPGSGTVTWTGTTGGGGFASHESALTVTLNNDAVTPIIWGAGGFVGTGGAQSLFLNSATSLAEVNFTNAIDLNSAVRTVNVGDNATTGTDFATMSGVLSGTGLSGLRKEGGGILRLTGANTYTGETTIIQGTLTVQSLGNSSAPGLATSVGTSTDANLATHGIVLGRTGNNAGLLQYVGAGETSDRFIQLGVDGGTGSSQIHADGSGALILTNVNNTANTAAKTLFLRGSNTAGNMITSALADNTGALSVTVDGGATWILTGANTYTGTTLVSAGALGIASSTLGSGAGNLDLNNGTVFAYGADRTVSNPVRLANNATTAVSGDYSLAFTQPLQLLNAANNTGLNNNIVSGKTLTLAGATANSLPNNANRTWTIDGSGTTIIAGDITTTQTAAGGLNLTKTGNGVLVLGGTGGGANNFNRNNAAIDLDRGTIRLGASEVIGDGVDTQAVPVAYGGLTISPEAVTGDTATFDLNGQTETVNALTATSNGTLVLDNTSSSPATFRFGANNSTVNFGSGTGSYSIQNSGTGALSLVKLGNTSTTFNSGILLNHAGITASEGGGSFTIAAPVNATSGLRAIGSSTLALTGGITNPGLITSIEVGGGSILSLLDGAGSAISNLTNLNLGAGSGTATLNLNIGDSATDTLTLLTGGTLNLANSVTFNLTDTGLSPLTTYTLLNLIDGGITAFGTGNMIQGATPGGFSGFTWNVTNNLVQITTGTLVTGSLYWRGLAGGGTDTTWNANANNWSQDKSNTIVGTTTPGQGTDVIFAIDSASGDVATTLEQNFKVNSLTFEAGTSTPTSVSIAPGAVATNRIEVAPQLATDGVEISAGGPASVAISAPFRLGANQTWHVADAGSTLTLSGGLLGERDVIKSGSGRVILGGAADATFNAGQTADFSINAGTLELTNVAALGTVVNGNLANVIVNSTGAFYYNGAAGTVPNPLTLNGGTLSSGTANQIYSGAVNLSGDSFINLRDSNSAVATTTARAVTLTGVLSGAGDITLDSINTASAGNQITGDLVISNAGNSGWSGDLIVRSGTVTARGGNGDTLGSGAITIELGKVEWEGAGGVTYNINKALTVARAGGNAVAEWNIDRTSGSGAFIVENAGALTLGGAGGTGELRVFASDAENSVARFTGPVTLANNAAIHVRDNATLVEATFSGGISETGGARSLIINGPAGGGTAWGGTSGIVHLSGASSYTGGTTLAAGNLRFGHKDAIGTGTLTISGASTVSASTALTGSNAVLNAITQSNALTFAGANSLELGGAINLGGAARTITTNSETGASLILSGAISGFATADGTAFTLAGNATGSGTIRGGFLMTGDAADMALTGGEWTHETGTSRVADDLTTSGANAVLNLNSGLFQVRDDLSVTANSTLNLNGTGALSFSTPTLSADASLRSFGGGTIVIGANNAVVVTDFDGLRIGTDGSGTGNLVMNANQTVSEFVLGNRNIDRTGNVTGTGTLTVTGNLDVYQGTIAANLASTGSTAFEKFSSNTVTLSGDNSGLASTGVTLHYEGSLILDYTSSNTTKLRAASALEMRGSNLVLNGNASAPTAQTVGGITLANGVGSSRITLNPGGSQEVVLNLGAITRAVNARAGTIRFVLPSGTQSATNGITTTTALVNGILGTAAYATVDDGTGVWFAGKSGNNIVALVSTAKNDVTTWLTGDHVTDETTGFTGAFSSIALNSLRLNAAGGSDIDLGNTGVLGLTTGGLLVTDQVAGTPSILNGTIFSGAQASNVPELILTHDGTTTFELGADIRANTAFTKSGTGTVLLSGNNTSTGDVAIHAGTVELSGANAIGDNARVTLASHRNSILRLSGNETIGRLEGGQRQTDGDWGVVEIGSHTLTLNQSASTTYAGRFTGSGTLVMSPSSTGNLNLNGISTGFTGNVVVKGGLFQLSVSGQIDAPMFNVMKGGALLIDNNGNTRSGTRILNTASIVLDSADGTFSGETRPRGLAVRINVNATTTETVGDLTFNSGANYFSGEASGTTGVTAIITSNFLRLNGSTLNARGRSLGLTTGDRAQLRIGDATNQTAFIASLIGGGGAADSPTVSIAPWAIGENLTGGLGDGNMGNTFLTYVSGTGFRPLSLTTEYSTYATAGDTNNVRESLNANLSGLSSRTLNSLVINNDNTAALSVLGSGVGQSLTNTSGGFLFTVTNGVASTAYNTELGGFNDGILTPAGEYIFHVINPSSAATTSLLTATVSSPLASTADLVKSGRGALVLSGVNTAGGGARKTFLNEGILEIGDLDNIGGATGDLVFAGGILRLGAAFDELTDDLSARSIIFRDGGGTLDTNGNDPVFAASLGSGTGGFTKTGLGNLTLNATASYTGATALSAGTITIGAANALGVGGNLTLAGGTTLALGSNSIQHGLVTTSGVSPAITGTGTINASIGFFLNHTGNTTIDAVLAGSGGLLKAQSNTVTLTGNNTYTGTTEIQNGTLSLASIGNVGGGASPIGAPTTVEDGIIRMGLTTAATTLQYTGTGHTSDRLIGMQGTTGGVTLDADGTGALVLGGVRTENAGNKTLTLRGSSAAGLENATGQIREVGAVLSVLKTDANTWAYNQSQSYTGTTSVDNGILRLNATQTMTGALQFGSINAITTTGTLEVKESSAFGSLLVRPNGDANVVVDPTKALTINGNVVIGTDAATSVTNFTATGGGDFSVSNTTNTGNTFHVGGTGTGNNTLADFSGLASMNVSLNTTGGTFLVSSSSGTNLTGKAEIRLADTTVITANALTVGGGGTFGGNANQVNQLKLGTAANVLNVNAINIGTGARDLGSITFQDVGGTVTVRAADGTAAAAFNMGTGTANTGVALAGNQNTFDVTGHNADLKFSTVNIGTQNRNADLVNVFSFDTGTLEIGSLTASTKGANGSTTTTTINIGGGTVTTGAWTLASASGAGTAVATANLTGGNITFSGAISRGADAAGGGTATGTVNLNGANLDMDGNTIGSATNQIVFNAQSGTLQNVGEINGGGNLVKTTAGTLVLAGDNNYTGRTVVSAGVLSISSEDNLGDNPVAFNAAQLEIDGGTLLTTASFTIDDTNRGITVGATGGTIETAVGTALTVASTNPIVLTGALTKTGDGALYINSTTSGTGAVNITDGTFGGTGTISGNTTIGNGAVLTGGTDGTVGTINFSGSLTNATGATWLIDLVGDVNGSSDLVNLGIGSLDLNNATLSLAVTNFTVGNTYTIASYGSLLSGSTFNGLGEGAVISGYQISYGANAITLTAVPEPGTLGLLGLALGGFFFRRLRKRRSDVSDEA